MGPRQWSRGRESIHILDRGDLRGASMGPRQWSRGRGRVNSRMAAGTSCFNGATAMEPWKSQRATTNYTVTLGLQWGHGNGAVEERSIVTAWETRKMASMGPRQWSRGRAEAALPAEGRSSR